MGERAVNLPSSDGEVLCNRASNVYDNSNSQSRYSRGRPRDTDAPDHQSDAQRVAADR